MGAFLDAFEHHVVSLGRVSDNEKLPLLVETSMVELGMGIILF